MQVHHNPALKLKTPIAYQKDTDLNAIPIMREGMGELDFFFFFFFFFLWEYALITVPVTYILPLALCKYVTVYFNLLYCLCLRYGRSGYFTTIIYFTSSVFFHFDGKSAGTVFQLSDFSSTPLTVQVYYID